MTIPACGYVPSIGVGHRRFYLIRGLVFWYALEKQYAVREGVDTRHQLDIRTLPSKYIDGLAVDDIQAEFLVIRNRHREALKRAIADNFDIPAHCAAEEAREIAETEARRQRVAALDVEDDDVPF